MPRLMLIAAVCLLSVCATGSRAAPLDLAPIVLPKAATPGKSVQPYVQVSAPVIVLVHARVIDGTGGPTRTNQTIVIEHGRIAATGNDGIPIPAGARQLDLSGHTVFPGLVGMHDHLFYIAQPNLAV